MKDWGTTERQRHRHPLTESFSRGKTSLEEGAKENISCFMGRNNIHPPSPGLNRCCRLRSFNTMDSEARAGPRIGGRPGPGQRPGPGIRTGTEDGHRGRGWIQDRGRSPRGSGLGLVPGPKSVLRAEEKLQGWAGGRYRITEESHPSTPVPSLGIPGASPWAIRSVPGAGCRAGV